MHLLIFYLAHSLTRLFPLTCFLSRSLTSPITTVSHQGEGKAPGAVIPSASTSASNSISASDAAVLPLVRIWMGWDVTVLRGWVSSVTGAIEKRLGRGSSGGSGKNNESGKDGGSDRSTMKSMNVDTKGGNHNHNHNDEEQGQGHGQGQGLAKSSSYGHSLTPVPHSPSAYYSPQTGEEIPPPPTLADFPSPFSIDGHMAKSKHMYQLEKVPQGYINDSHVEGGHWSENTFSPGFSPGGYTPTDMASPHMVMTSLTSPRTVFKACVEELTERQNTNHF